MRKLPVALCLFFASSTAQAEVDWTGGLYTTSGDSPTLAVASDRLHMAWYQGATVRYAELDHTGQLLRDLDVADGDGGAYSHPPAVGVGPNGEIWVAHKRTVGEWTYDGLLSRSTGGAFELVSTLFNGTLAGWAPRIVADGLGTSVTFAKEESEFAIHHWLFDSDGTQLSYTPSLLETRGEDAAVLLAGPAEGERHLFTSNFYGGPSGKVMYAWSTDAGATWHEVGSLSLATDCLAMSHHHAALAPDGAIHLTYLCETTEHVAFARYHAVLRDHGQVVENEIVSDEGEITAWYMPGQIAVTTDGTVIIAYNHGANEGAAPLVARHKAPSENWSAAVPLAPVGTTAFSGLSMVSEGFDIFIAYTDGADVHVHHGVVPAPDPIADAGVPDAAPSDAGALDAGALDAGDPDASDASTPDLDDAAHDVGPDTEQDVVLSNDRDQESPGGCGVAPGSGAPLPWLLLLCLMTLRRRST